MLVSKDEVCKIADFGLSRETDSDNAYNMKTVRRHLQIRGMSSSCDYCRKRNLLFSGQPLRQFTIAGSHPQVMSGVLGSCYGK